MCKFPWLTVAFSLALTACGGGGDTTAANPTVSSSADFQLRSAWINHVSGSRSLTFNVTGSVDGTNVSGTGIGTQSSLVSTTFEGGPALRASTSLSMTLNPGNLTIATTSYGYIDSNYNYLGSSGDAGYSVVSSSEVIPTTAKVNANGVLYTENLYSDSSKSLLLGTETTSYSLEPDTADTALLKIIQVQKNTGNAITGNSTVTFRMTTAGSLTRLSETAFITTPAVVNLSVTYN